MQCEGYDRSRHEVDSLHGHGLCYQCYQHKYRDDHRAELAAYQKTYRSGPEYAEQNRGYVAEFRARHE